MSSAELTAIKAGLIENIKIFKRSYQNPLQHAQQLQQTYGNVVMQKLGRFKTVHLFGADANRLALLNPDQILSNKKSWDMIIGRIFPNGLMLRDGDDHRYHRRIMQVGFKKPAMEAYLQQMLPLIKDRLNNWPERQMLAFPAFKQLTLDLAAQVFLGLELGPQAAKINQAFATTVEASMPLIPFALPGTLLRRGIKAREYMVDFFAQLIPEKRQSDGKDMFSLLCRAQDEQGNQYTDQEIIDHLIFLMMAAHDTTTSTLTSMVYALAKNPQWQQTLHDESVQFDAEHIQHADLDKMPMIDLVIKEALRLYPPLSTLPKYSIKAFEFEGFKIPADAMVITYPIHTHHLSEHWSQPEQFDPLRFSDDRAEHKAHPYSWIPFSGGAHMCIGLHFANMQIKAIMVQLLQRYRWSVDKDYQMPVQMSPISKPKDDLPIMLYAR